MDIKQEELDALLERAKSNELQKGDYKHTCNHQDINPFEYLTILQEHSSEIFQNPGTWLPWTFEGTIGQKLQETADNP